MICNKLCSNVYLLIYLFSVGARPKFTKRNSMDSVELWKYSSDKVISLTRTLVRHFTEKCAHTPLTKELLIPLQQYVLLLQNGENQDLEGIPRRSRSQLSQPGKRKGYPDSQSSDERPWLDSPVDADDITVQVPPPVPVSSCSFIVLLASYSDPRMLLMWGQV